MKMPASDSRICVKNLPPYATEANLKEHFSARGLVTDVKIIKTSDGQSRRFGFIGYRTEEEAKVAAKFFDKSFVDTFRLSCEMARAIGDPNNPRPWSRHSKGSSAFEKQNKPVVEKTRKVKEQKKSRGEEEADVQLLEFMNVMQPRSKTKLWANDSVVGTAQLSAKTPVKVSANTLSEKIEKSSEDDSDEEYFDPVPKLEDESAEVEEEEEKAVSDNKLSDMDYLKAKITGRWSDDEDSDEESTDGSDNDRGNDESEIQPESEEESKEEAEKETEEDRAEAAPESNVTELPSEQESVSETGRLFVRNLPYTASEGELADLFSQYGELSEVHLVLDKETNRSKGFAYILFMVPEAAVRAFKELDKTSFQGRLLHILPAKPPRVVPEKEKAVNGGNKFKKERESQRKELEASGNTKAWNSLFMRQDTVAANIAQQYGVSKGELLDTEKEDLAVRLALGETHIIAQTKQALNKQGVNVAVLENLGAATVKRSQSVILVKNLPFATTETDLAELFGRYGTIGRLILPPTKTIAIVEFLESHEARKAFKSLAYSRFKHVPLYLEWAPHNLVDIKKPSEVVVAQDQLNRVAAESNLLAATDDNDMDVARARSVYVKNLNFKTSEAALRKHFEDNMQHGSLRKITIKMHQSKTGKQLSMGFGFVEFDSVETAKAICKSMQGSVVDGHALILQLSHSSDAVKAVSRATKTEICTKIIVRNVAFEATKKDLMQLFAPFGQIKSLRLPKKFDNTHRGFAFVEFVTKQEAENAYDALSSTHLYGRHLVLERARKGESIDELRAKTASQFRDDNEIPLKRRRQE